ncbi:SRPBCC family protein [Actinacidiphila sp. DG2A-62]|uniref:SRPBCC family protein n=1 Tax=Actinacidiphila sp. DG2A-62 TaxID=3108821 RepID=UPI002DB5F179|nr:SRPBCC family protein [Actinacidiphila sp. DG2A-62]MEC3992985.1 SRPBCC family protein [Actinacidiphila sp. DG2A-62]
MDWSHYRFRSAWHLDAAPDAVYRVLERPDRYPEWWPQIREVQQTGETSGVLRFRSVLPYDLVVAASATRHDPRARVLEIAMTGDLEGWVRWTVLDSPVRPHASAPADGPADGPAAASSAPPSRPPTPADGSVPDLPGGTWLLFEQEVEVRKLLMRAFAVPCRPLFVANHAMMMRRGRAGLHALLAASATAGPLV